MLSSCGSNQGAKRSKKDNSTETANINSVNDFETFWQTFAIAIKDKDYNTFRKNSLEKIRIGVNAFDIDSLFKYYSELFDDKLINSLPDKKRIEFIDSELEEVSLLTSQLKSLSQLKIKEVNITKNDKYPDQVIIVLRFVETAKSYKFYAYDSFGENIKMK